MARGNKKPTKETRTFEFRIYTITAIYAGDLELLATLQVDFKDMISYSGRPITSADDEAKQYAENIGRKGITIEDPVDTYTFYPPERIFKVEYTEIEDNGNGNSKKA